MRLVAFCTAAVVLSSCGPREQAVDAAGSLRFAQLPISDSAVTQLAQSKGFIKEAGLEYAAISVPAGPDVVSALKAPEGSGADAGGIAITPVVTMMGAHDQPVILATTLRSNYSAQLVTSTGTGITNDPATLRGKRIGIVRNTVGDIYLFKLLRRARLNYTDVTLVNARPPELRSLIIRGDIDAAVLWDPFLRQAVRGYREALAAKTTRARGEPSVFVDPALHTQVFNVVTTRDKLKSHRPALLKLLKALLKAEQYISNDRAGAQAETETWLGLVKGDLDEVFAKAEYRVSLDVPYLKQQMQEHFEWLRRQQPDTFVPTDFSPYIDASLLKSVAGDRVIE